MTFNPPMKRRQPPSHWTPVEVESTQPLQVAQRPQQRAGYHAQLTTTNALGRVEELFLALDHHISVGRSPSSVYMVPQAVVSSTHFVVHALPAASGGIYLACEDLSTNGTIWNGHLIRKTAIIISDGDVLQIPRSQSFRVCVINKLDTHVQESQPINLSRGPTVKYKRMGSYLVSNQYLGDGSFGKVRLAIDDAKNRQLACKTIWTSPRAGHNATKSIVQKEINILRGLTHPNINKIIDVFYEDQNENIHIFLELCTGGDLLQYMELRNPLKGGEAKYIGFQIMKALQPENVLVLAPGSYPRVMLADFGFARNNSHERTRSLCGTVSYVPPEAMSVLFGYNNVQTNGGYNGMAFDCWSLGVCLYFMISGIHPFDNKDLDEPSQVSSDDAYYNMAERIQDGDQPPVKRPRVDSPWTSQVQAQADSRMQQDRSSSSSSSISSDEQAPEYPSQRSTSSEDRIQQRVMRPVRFNWRGWSQNPEAELLIQGLLNPNANERLTVMDALLSSWITKDLDALEEMYAKRVGGV